MDYGGNVFTQLPGSTTESNIVSFVVLRAAFTLKACLELILLEFAED